jgi:hypothetical protein
MGFAEGDLWSGCYTSGRCGLSVVAERAIALPPNLQQFYVALLQLIVVRPSGHDAC